MLRALYLTSGLLIVCAAGRAGAQETVKAEAEAEAEATLPEWGQIIDPDGDCTIRFDDRKVVIQVPGTPHDLSVELDRMNAPRVLCEVEGDFIVEVRAAGTFHPGGETKIPGRTAYNGAGLLVWADRDTYIRLERAALTRGEVAAGNLFSYANFEIRQGGEQVPGKSFQIPDEPITLRLERRGDRFMGFVSADGLEWQSLGTFEARLPTQVQVGVAAINSAAEPFTAELVDFALFERRDGD